MCYKNVPEITSEIVDGLIMLKQNGVIIGFCAIPLPLIDL